MKKNLKGILILSILFLLYIFICAYSYVSAVSSSLSDSVFRLHVIANSDSDEDQNLKYIVRDKLISYMNEQCKDFSNKHEVIQYSQNHLNELKKIAENAIYEQGFSYPVTIEIGNFEFPTKTYGDISFPAGYYDALRVKIGESNGQNWWCVMFPPLCFINTTNGIVPDTSKKTLEQNLSEENYQIISDTDNSGFQIKFKLIEFFEKTGILTAKNN